MPGRIGRYVIQRRLGIGGMGSLFLARDPGLDRLVAIKLLREDSRDEPELRERFIREARSVARLRHPNIVIVHDVGEEEGRPFMAMEYIAGETLTQVLRRTPSLAIPERLALFESLCAGLAHAHSAGIIHRDIKPANVMLDSDGVLKILDFGIARLGNSGITQDGMMMGTINYMSPEQVVGRGVDHRTDIFSAGAVLYEIIALEQAFPGGVDAGVLHRILNEGPVPLDQRVPSIDPELASIVRRALEREPTRRYQDADEMRLDVIRVRRRLTEEAVAGGASLQGTTVIDQSKPKPSGSGRKGDSDRPGRLSPERLAQLRRQQVEEHLRFSEEAFARGDHDAALHHAERAATVDPDSRAAIDLIDKARFAIEAKAIRQLLGEANRLLSEGNLEDAAALADEASVTLPDLEGSSELRREVRQAVDKIAATRDRERRIGESLERAKASIERGGYETALRAVYEILALDPERPEARELEHTAKTRLQTQRQHDQARRNAYESLKDARALADSGKYDEAVKGIQAVIPPSDTVRTAAADALAAVRKLQRQAAHAAIVAEARESLEGGNIEQALAAIDSIPPDERSEEARSVGAAAEDVLRQRRELERKRQAFEAAIAAIQQLIAAGDLAKAFERLEDAARIGVEDERIPALRQHIADLGVAAQERRQQQARDRLAAKRVEAARQLLADGNGYAAVALLERAGSGHPLVEQALREIRVAIAEQEERVRQEAERKRQEEEARRRSEIEAARKLDEQRRAEEQRLRQEEERRAREAEQQRRRQAVGTLLLSVEQALRADRPDEATRLLKAADEDIDALQDTALRQRAAAAKAEAERLERRRREEARRQEEEARKREEDARQREAALVEILTKARRVDADEAALTLLNEAATLAPGDQRVHVQIAERKAALEHRRAEEEQRRVEEFQRVQEAQKREEEARRVAEEARKREAEVADLIGRARQVREHDAALTLLKQAETIAPGDSRLVTLISERSAALDAQRAVERATEEAAQRERERERIRRQVEGHVARARELVARGDLAAAREAADAALALDADDRDAKQALGDIADEERRRAEEAREREAAIADLIDQAGQVPDHGAALTLLRQAVTLMPGDPRLRTLIRERSAALDAHRAAEKAAEEAARRERERLAQQERDAAAAAVVEKARQIFAEGHHNEAVALLQGSPPHASIQRVITELESRRVDIERARAREARRRQRQERRTAVVAMLQRGISDRRLHLTGVAIVLIAVAATAWQLWSVPQQSVSLQPTTGTPSPLSPGPGTSPPTPGLTPPGPQPPAPVPASPSPPSPGRGTSPPTPGSTSPGPQPPAPVPVSPSPPSPGRGASPPAPGSTPPEPQPPTPVLVSPSPASPGTVTPPQQKSDPAPFPGTPPSPGPPPVQPATPPQVPNLQAEEMAIRQLLDRWVAAYNRMDEAGLRAIDPAFDGIRSRPLLRSVDLRLSPITINVTPDGRSAVLQATQNFTYEWNRAGFPRTTSGMLRWNLQKKGTAWVVVP